MLLFIVELLLVGVGVGVVSAALGIGGGLLMVPAFLEFVPGMDAHTAKGTSLFIIVFVSILNTWQLSHPGEPKPWRQAATLIAGSIVGGYVGAWMTAFMTDRAVTWIFVAVVTFLGIRMLLHKEKRAEAHAVSARHAVGLGIGVVTGVVAGMTGIGGGNIMVPLVLLAGLIANEKVVLLSNMVMIGTSLASSVAHFQAAATYPDPSAVLSSGAGAEAAFLASWTFGQVSLALAPLVLIGAQLGIPLGKGINRHLTFTRRRYVMAALLLFIAARLTWRSLAA